MAAVIFVYTIARVAEMLRVPEERLDNLGIYQGSRQWPIEAALIDCKTSGSGVGMECVCCGSAAVTERPERTAWGYRRFRCRECGKQFNERSAAP